MPRFVDSGEREVAVLSDFAILLTAPDERLVARRSELFAVCVVHCERDCLSAEPVTDIVSIAIEQADTNTAPNNF